jgi:hypothetical protein
VFEVVYVELGFFMLADLVVWVLDTPQTPVALIFFLVVFVTVQAVLSLLRLFQSVDLCLFYVGYVPIVGTLYGALVRFQS